MTATPRRPWVAAVLSIALPGLGQLYGGRPLRALVCHLAYLASIVAALAVLLELPAPPWNVVGAVLIAGLGFAAVAVDAIGLVEKGLATAGRAWDRGWIYVAAIVLVTFVGGSTAAGIVRARIVAAYRLPSQAMVPALLPGDAFLVWRVAEPRAGDIVVVVRADEGEVVRRVVALAGQEVAVWNEDVWVDGRVLETPARVGPPPGLRRALVSEARQSPRALAPGTAFVVADNHRHAGDSREWGAIPADTISGRVAVIYWSYDAAAGRVRWDRIGRRFE